MIEGLLSSLREKLRPSGRDDSARPPAGTDSAPDPADLETGDGEAPDRATGSAEPGSVGADELADEQKMALAALKEAAAVGEAHRPPMPELPGWEPDRPPLELDLIRVPETRGLGLELEALARELVRSIVEGADGEELAALKSGALSALDEAARVAGLAPREFLERLGGDAPRGSAPEEMDALLQEAAVEGHGVLLGFGLDEDADGEPEGLSDARFTWEPADERRLEVVRMARLFARLESSLLGEPYLAAQLRISRWWFARWWFGRAGGAAERGREVRRREWALLDRDLPGLDGTVLEAFRAQEAAASLPPGQASLARRLSRSVVGAFEVVDRSGDRAVLEDVRTGERRRVTHHPGEAEPEVATVAIGRLWPAGAGEEAWIRSRGIVHTGPERLGEAREMGQEVLEAAAAEGRDRAIAMEIMLRALHGEEKPPRDLKPALSRKLARETLKWTVTALKGAGLARTVPEDEAPVDAGGRKLAGAGETLLESRVDEATAAWLTELDEQARGLG